ncbi:sand protein-related [Anaeramoeba ignava]|uniref:Sand protein-related n=1 Tax=Anaeramoeba ignava TaxID=1746090 RepID=A0A9Q0L6Z2_ANAIG|nr:sand protein-related [Anaeramoeba ignava]
MSDNKENKENNNENTTTGVTKSAPGIGLEAVAFRMPNQDPSAENEQDTNVYEPDDPYGAPQDDNTKSITSSELDDREKMSEIKDNEIDSQNQDDDLEINQNQIKNQNLNENQNNENQIEDQNNENQIENQNQNQNQNENRNQNQNENQNENENDSFENPKIKIEKHDDNQFNTKFQRLYAKYSNEDTSSPGWAKHKKHFFIISSSGKPIYTRYGDDSKLSGFMCVPQALISFVSDFGDTIKWVHADDHKIVFVIKGPIYLVCVSKTGEPVSQLTKQLNFLYGQIISILTNRAIEILKKKPHYDLRILLAGTEKFLDSVIYEMNNNFTFIVNGVPCLKIDPQIRKKVGQILFEQKIQHLVFSILLAKKQLVHIAVLKKIISPTDMFLLINFAQNESFKTSQSWTPICLPHYNNSAHLYAYINYLDHDNDICLLLMSRDMRAFEAVQSANDNIVKQLTENKVLDEVRNAVQESEKFTMSDVKIDGLILFTKLKLTHQTQLTENKVLDEVRNAVQESEKFTMSDVKIDGLLHFIYKINLTHQTVCPKVSPPYTIPKERKRLFRLYEVVRTRLASFKSSITNKTYFRVSDSETVLGRLEPDYELYTVFSPLISKSETLKKCEDLLEWIKNQEDQFFIQHFFNW